MKLPQIQGINKIRDARICRLYAEDFLSTEEIGEKVGLTARRIRQILYKNRAFLNLDKEWERQKRIHWLKRQIVRRGDTEKDSADLLAQLRDELEGKKALEIKNIINVGTNGKLTDADREWQKQTRDRLHKRYEV